MPLDLAPDALIRGGSGLLFSILALFVLATSRARLRHLALGVLLLGFGAYFLLANVTGGGADWTWLIFVSALGLVAPLVWPLLPRRAEAGPLAVALVATLAVAAMELVRVREVGESGYVPNAVARSIAAGTLFLWTARAAAAPDPVARTRLAALALALGVYAAWSYGTVLAEIAGGFAAAAHVVVPILIASCALAWVAVGVRRGERAPVLVGLALAATLLGGEIKQVLVPTLGVDTTGSIGLARTAGWCVLAWAILRHDLLEIGMRPVTIRRGTAAAGALAALFVVAQVAQNFLAAQYGLIMGGVVAGAMLFAAAPIQRAIEGASGGPDAARTGPVASRLAESERAYKIALRRFLLDGRVAPEEEVALAHLADEAGLTIRRATEIRHEVERELAEARR